MSRAYLLRHAKAGDRYKFSGPDLERPLTPPGRQQAEQIAARIEREEPCPGLLLSSPARRCVETLQPLADRLGLAVGVAAWLDEGSDVDAALRRLRALDEVAVACTHGDVIWGVLEQLAREGVDLGERPDAAKGSIWVLEWSPPRAVYEPPPQRLEARHDAAC